MFKRGISLSASWPNHLRVERLCVYLLTFLLKSNIHVLRDNMRAVWRPQVHLFGFLCDVGALGFIWFSWSALLARTRDDVCRALWPASHLGFSSSHSLRQREDWDEIMREESVHEAMRLDNWENKAPAATHTQLTCCNQRAKQWIV